MSLAHSQAKRDLGFANLLDPKIPIVVFIYFLFFMLGTSVMGFFCGGK